MSDNNSHTLERRFIGEGLFALGADGITLVGGRCRGCRTVTFPQQAFCPRCGAEGQEREELPRVGTLWSFTVQTFRPKSPFLGPVAFTPFGVGYVDLGEVIVESRLTVNDAALLSVGLPMVITPVVNHVDEDGVDVGTFAFEPRADEAQETGR